MQLPAGDSPLARSVMVPTHGRSELLAALLDRLAAHTLAPERFEGFAVDDRPSPWTRRAPRSH